MAGTGGGRKAQPFRSEAEATLLVSFDSKDGESWKELNLPSTFRYHNGFEDRRGHRTPSAPNEKLLASAELSCEAVFYRSSGLTVVLAGKMMTPGVLLCSPVDLARTEPGALTA